MCGMFSSIKHRGKVILQLSVVTLKQAICTEVHDVYAAPQRLRDAT